MKQLLRAHILIEKYPPRTSTPDNIKVLIAPGGHSSADRAKQNAQKTLSAPL
jgi:hypothetical protein